MANLNLTGSTCISNILSVFQTFFLRKPCQSYNKSVAALGIYLAKSLGSRALTLTQTNTNQLPTILCTITSANYLLGLDFLFLL